MSDYPPPQTIWYVSKYVAAPTRGAGGRGYELMRSIAARGHTAVIVTSDANHLTEVPELTAARQVDARDGLLVCWLRTFKAPRAKSLRRMVSWLHFEWAVITMPKHELPKPDVVIASSLSLLTVLSGLVLSRRHRAKFVFEVRDIWPLTLTEEGGFSPHNPLVRMLAYVERLGYRRADAIVGTMPNLSSHVQTVLGGPKEAICIPMGFPDEALEGRPVPSEYLDTFVPKNKFVVGYAGTIGITNALDTLFDVAERLRHNSAVHFVVLGDGDLLDDYRVRHAHLPNLTFAPKVSKDQVQSVLAAFDVLYLSVHPSKVWEYGQSLNKLIDYMLAGKPIIASYTGFPSMVDEAGCGSFVPAGDVAALADQIAAYADMGPSDRAAIGARGRQWLIRHRRYEVLADRYLHHLAAIETTTPGNPRGIGDRRGRTR